METETCPLNNSLILGMIFGYCAPKELAVVRLVCRKWNLESYKQWRSTARVILPFRCSGARVSQFSRIAKRRTFCERPFLAYKMLFKIPVDLKSIYGQFVRELVLERVKFSSITEAKLVLFNACPSMQKLTITDCYLKERTQGLQVLPSPDLDNREINLNMQSIKYTHTCNGVWTPNIFLELSWSETFQHYPKLTEIKSICSHPLENLVSLGTAVAQTRNEHPDWLNLKTLILSLSDNVTEIESFKNYMLDPRTTISHLGLILIGRHVQFNSILQAVKVGLGHSLEELCLKLSSSESVERQTVLGMSQFKKLRWLSICGDGIDSLDFLRDLPLLVALRLTSNGLIERSSTDTTGSIIKGLHTLELAKISNGSIRKIDMLFTWFPNITNLSLCKLSADDARLLFPMICQFGTNVRDLVVQMTDQCHIGDELITGFTEEAINFLGDLCLEDLMKSTMPTNVPNITWLKRLQILKMEVVQRRHFTDSSAQWQSVKSDRVPGNISAIFGFLRCSALFSLALENSKICDELVAALRTQIMHTEFGNRV